MLFQHQEANMENIGDNIQQVIVYVVMAIDKLVYIHVILIY